MLLLLPQHNQTVQRYGYIVIVPGTATKPTDSPQNSSQGGSLRIIRARDQSAQDVGLNREHKQMQLLLLCTMFQYRPGTTLMAQRTAMLPTSTVRMHHSSLQTEFAAKIFTSQSG